MHVSSCLTSVLLLCACCVRLFECLFVCLCLITCLCVWVCICVSLRVLLAVGSSCLCWFVFVCACLLVNSACVVFAFAGSGLCAFGLPLFV